MNFKFPVKRSPSADLEAEEGQVQPTNNVELKMKIKSKTMNHVYTIPYFLIALFLITGCQPKSIPKSSTDKFDNRIDSVLALMTLDEKIGQMTLFTTDWGST